MLTNPVASSRLCKTNKIPDCLLALQSSCSASPYQPTSRLFAEEGCLRYGLKSTIKTTQQERDSSSLLHILLYSWNHISLSIFNFSKSLLKYSGQRFRIINSIKFNSRGYLISLWLKSKWLWNPSWRIVFLQCYMWLLNTPIFWPWKISLLNVLKWPSLHIWIHIPLRIESQCYRQLWVQVI